MILIDTSAWIDFFRGQGRLEAQVDQAIEQGDAATCGPIITELRRGITKASQAKQVLGLLEGCTLLEQPADLWQQAGSLGAWLQTKGVHAKTLDLLIANYALSHDCELLSADKDFFHMQQAGLPLRLMQHHNA